jgi:putative transposase
MKRYDSDVTDAQWEALEPYVKKRKRRGPKSRADLRQVVNGIFYRLRTGCQWRLLPKEYGNWEKVSAYWYRWSANGLWETVNTALREALREKSGRKRQPTAAVIDSQSVKTAQKGGSAVMTRASRSRAVSGTSR